MTSIEILNASKLFYGDAQRIIKNSEKNAQEFDIKEGVVETKGGYYVEIKDGWTENDPKMGDCKIELNQETFVRTSTFYDNNKNIIGACNEYFGPGSSGGNKVGCDSTLLLSNIIVNGAKLPKYICITN